MDCASFASFTNVVDVVQYSASMAVETVIPFFIASRELTCRTLYLVNSLGVPLDLRSET